MPYSHYDRLSGMDSIFLGVEDDAAHMHIASVGIFEVGPLKTADGGIDFDRIMAFSDAALRGNPRFRQKLAYVPVFGTPVWVDDAKFNLNYHIRHTQLPAPGSVRQLKRLAGRIVSQQLDRGKPLWEMWFVEGLEGDRFAVITKVHHSIADGISGAELLAAMMRPTPDDQFETKEWIPRPAPTPDRLFRDELMRRMGLPLSAVRNAIGTLPSTRSLRDAADSWSEMRETMASSLTPASQTPFNMDLGPYRRFDWLRFELDEFKEIGHALGGKVNDVVLTVVTGAVSRFLENRGCDVRELDFRAVVPVSFRPESEARSLGNQVSNLIASLPLDEPDPIECFRRVVETMKHLKSSSQALGLESLAALVDWTSPGLMASVVRLALRLGTSNLAVTNIPGPRETLYTLGAPMVEVYPVVPLTTNQTLGIAIFSYAGGLFWGFNADWDALPDLHEIVEGVQLEFERLQKAVASGAG